MLVCRLKKLPLQAQDKNEFHCLGGAWSPTYLAIFTNAIPNNPVQPNPHAAILRGTLRLLAQLGDRLHSKWRVIPAGPVLQDWNTAVSLVAAAAGMQANDPGDRLVVANAMLVWFPFQFDIEQLLLHHQQQQAPQPPAQQASLLSPVQRRYTRLVKGYTWLKAPFLSPCSTLDFTRPTRKRPRLFLAPPNNAHVAPAPAPALQQYELEHLPAGEKHPDWVVREGTYHYVYLGSGSGKSVWIGAHEFVLWAVHGYPRHRVPNNDGVDQPRVLYSVKDLDGDTPKRPVVIHVCNTPGCINPLHLYYGTTARNVKASTAHPSGRVENARLMRMSLIQAQSMRHLGLANRQLGNLVGPLQAANLTQQAMQLVMNQAAGL